MIIIIASVIFGILSTKKDKYTAPASITTAIPSNITSMTNQVESRIRGMMNKRISAYDRSASAGAEMLAQPRASSYEKSRLPRTILSDSIERRL